MINNSFNFVEIKNSTASRMDFFLHLKSLLTIANEKEKFGTFVLNRVLHKSTKFPVFIC